MHNPFWKGILLISILLASNCDPKRISFQEILNENPDRKELELNHKRFTDSLENIGNLSSLTSLSLNYDGLDSLPDSVGNLNQLKKLSLYGNSITSLPTSFKNLQQLEILLLGKNPFTQIPASIANLPNLKILSLDETLIRLTKEDVKILASLPKLEILDLSENLNIIKIPENTSSLKEIKTIFLKKNKLNEIERERLFNSIPNVVLIK